MPEPEDTINTPDGTDTEAVDTQETAPATDDANTPAGTEVDEGADTQPADGQDTDSFLNDKTQKELDDFLIKNPELKPNYDYLHKKLQGDYTRKMQSVPKEFRDSKVLNDLKAQAAIAKQIQGDPKLVKLIQDYKAGGLKQDTPKAEAVADVIGELTKDFAPEEKMLLDRLMPVFEKKIGQMIDPLQKATAQSEEKSAMAELSGDEAYALIPVQDYWEDVKANRAKYPGMSYKEALNMAIGGDFKVIAPQIKEFGKEDVLNKNKAKGPAKAKAAFMAGGEGGGADKANDGDDDVLSPEAYAKKHGIPTRGEPD